jgi:hypothetical protein
MHFCNVICFDQFGDEDAPDSPVKDIIEGMCDSGKAGLFVHQMENGFPQWECLCSLEAALVENGLNKDWIFVVGMIEGDDETEGWLEYAHNEDVWVVIPRGPLGKENWGSDVAVINREDFDETDYKVFVFASAADDSAMKMNKILKALGRPLL